MKARIAAGILGLMLLTGQPAAFAAPGAFGYLTATSYRVGVGCVGGQGSNGDVSEMVCDGYETEPGSPMFHRGVDFFDGWFALLSGIGLVAFALKGPAWFVAWFAARTARSMHLVLKDGEWVSDGTPRG